MSILAYTSLLLFLTTSYFFYSAVVSDIYFIYRFVLLVLSVLMLSMFGGLPFRAGWYTYIHVYWLFLTVLVLFLSHRPLVELFSASVSMDFYGIHTIALALDSVAVSFGANPYHIKFNNLVYLYLSSEFLPLTVSLITVWSLLCISELLYFVEDFTPLLFI